MVYSQIKRLLRRSRTGLVRLVESGMQRGPELIYSEPCLPEKLQGPPPEEVQLGNRTHTPCPEAACAPGPSDPVSKDRHPTIDG